MKLSIIGGGGFRVPQIYQAVSSGDSPLLIDEISLYDVSSERLSAITAVITELAADASRTVVVSATTDIDEALKGASFVFSAMRIGGLESRILDERIALELGVLGQETIGPGGLSYALRTLPHARELALRIRRHAPEAWVINFTNPAGIITEAMREILGSRVTGICDTPIGLMRRTARAVGHAPHDVDFDYVGLNHLGWLRRLSVGERDLLPELLSDDATLTTIEEARIFGADWVRALGALPNEYLFYYYFGRESLERISSSPSTRGQYLARQQNAFYSRMSSPGRGGARQEWERTLHERESSYMPESRPHDAADQRDHRDVENGGYQKVALDLMTALVVGQSATMILNVSNDSAGGELLVPALPSNAVIEVPCTVDSKGIHPHRVGPVRGDMLGLMVQVKACEQLVIEASTRRSPELAWRAFAGHPLVDSVSVGRQLLEQYRELIPGVAESFNTD